MIKLFMQKNYFHNYKLLEKKKVKKQSFQTSKLETKSIVDVNILLNRVKIEKKNETKRKIFLFSFAILALSMFGTFVVSIK